jgi:hypothetical protein
VTDLNEIGGSGLTQGKEGRVSVVVRSRGLRFDGLQPRLRDSPSRLEGILILERAIVRFQTKQSRSTVVSRLEIRVADVSNETGNCNVFQTSARQQKDSKQQQTLTATVELVAESNVLRTYGSSYQIILLAFR